MKKLIIALAAVTMAVVANAAQCNWSGNSIALNGTAAVDKYSVYLLDAGVTSAADMASALSKGDTSKLAGAMVTTTSGIAVGTTAARWTSTFGNYAAGNSYTYYTVIFNNSASSATAYMITSEKTGQVPASGNLVMTFGSQSGNSWNNVPEPTSAMLLLLGVAGLALRRKQK